MEASASKYSETGAEVLIQRLLNAGRGPLVVVLV